MILEVKNVRKVFPGVVSLDGVNFQVKSGEVHGLLGENGAGKSTLISILYGVYLPDSGDVFINGVKTEIKSPRHANKLGISLISQQFALVPTLTVRENLELAGVKLGEVERYSELLEIEIPLDRAVTQLTMGERQRVEVLKALAKNSEILLMDEPTALLSPREVDAFLTLVRKLADMGKAVVFVTHKIREVVRVADRITVLRRGRQVGEFRKPFDERELLEAMFQTAVVRSRREKTVAGDTVYRAENLVGERVFDSSVTVRSGEVVAVLGVAGNGQDELMELLSGFKRVRGGKIYLQGFDMSGKPYVEFLKRGVVYLPEDRSRALARELSVLDNFKVRCTTNCREKLREVIEILDIDVPDVRERAAALSGGNQQKLLLAREILLQKPTVLVASYPTRGLDMETTEKFYKIVRERCGAVVLSLQDVEEAIEKVDKIYVMSRGRITAHFTPPYDFDQVAEAMAA